MRFFTSLIATSLAALFMDLATRLRSTEFLQTARHPEHPTALSRQRKLPLPTLVALMLTGMRMSIQAELDVFFGHLQGSSQLLRTVSEQAFAQARQAVTDRHSLAQRLAHRARRAARFRSALVPPAPGRRRRLDHALVRKRSTNPSLFSQAYRWLNPEHAYPSHSTAAAPRRHRRSSRQASRVARAAATCKVQRHSPWPSPAPSK